MSDHIRRLRERVGNELLVMPSVSVAVRDEQDRVLLVHHSDTDQWVTPGGAIEPDENPADAAVREVWEETGLDIELLRVVGVYGGPEFRVHYSNGDVTSYVVSVFEGRARGGSLRPDHDEIREVRFFADSELDSLELRPWVKRVIADLRSDLTGASFEAPRWRPPESDQ